MRLNRSDPFSASALGSSSSMESIGRLGYFVRPPVTPATVTTRRELRRPSGPRVHRLTPSSGEALSATRVVKSDEKARSTAAAIRLGHFQASRIGVKLGGSRTRQTFQVLTRQTMVKAENRDLTE